MKTKNEKKAAVKAGNKNSAGAVAPAFSLSRATFSAVGKAAAAAGMDVSAFVEKAMLASLKVIKSVGKGESAAALSPDGAGAPSAGSITCEHHEWFISLHDSPDLDVHVTVTGNIEARRTLPEPVGLEVTLNEGGEVSEISHDLALVQARALIGALARAVAFAEGRGILIENATASAPSAPMPAGGMVCITREAAEDAAKLMLEFFECCVSSTFDWDDIPGSIRRGLAALHAAKCAGDGDALHDYPGAVVDARNYVAIMRALGKGEGLPDVDALVGELEAGVPAGGAAAKK